MKQMRWLVAILVIWLFGFYNLERLSGPINLTRAAYILVPILAVVTISMPSLNKIPAWFHVGLPVPLFLLLKRALVGRLWGNNFPFTVTEICAIMLTVVLARQVGIVIADFELVLNRISLSGVNLDKETGNHGYALMNREIRRARKYKRPLSLLAIVAGDDSVDVALDRMTLEVQKAMMRHYVLCGVGNALSEALDDYNLIALNKSRFLVLLPEITSDAVQGVVDQVRKTIQEQVGVVPQIGFSSFPEDALTFEGLISRATDGSNLRDKTIIDKQHIQVEPMEENR